MRIHYTYPPKDGKHTIVKITQQAPLIANLEKDGVKHVYIFRNKLGVLCAGWAS